MKTKFRNIAQIQEKARRYGQQLPAAMSTIIDANFIEGVNNAKANAPWTDRTGDARRSIDYENRSDANMLRFYIFIGVYYGIFLEYANGGKYRILQPTFTVMEVKILKDLERLGVKMKGGI